MPSTATLNKQNPPHLSIHHASYTANIGLISYALSAGVSPNALLEGFTPLHLACASSFDTGEATSDGAQVIEAVKQLISRGADVNAKRLGAPGGSSSAVATGKWKVGGVVGSTPLHIALYTPHPPHILHSIVSLLLSVGADPTLRDKDGRRPSQIPSHLVKQAQMQNKPTFLIPEEVIQLVVSAEKTWMAQFPSSRRGGSRMNASAAGGSGRPGTSSGTARPESRGQKVQVKRSIEGTFASLSLNLNFRPKSSSNSSPTLVTNASSFAGNGDGPNTSSTTGGFPVISAPVQRDMEAFHSRRPSLPVAAPTLPPSSPPISFSRALRTIRPSSAGAGGSTAYITTSQQLANNLPFGPQSRPHSLVSTEARLSTPTPTPPTAVLVSMPPATPTSPASSSKKPSKYSIMGILKRTTGSSSAAATTDSNAYLPQLPVSSPFGVMNFQTTPFQFPPTTKRPHTAPMQSQGSDFGSRSSSEMSHQSHAMYGFGAMGGGGGRMMTPPRSDATPSPIPTPTDYGFPPVAPPNSPDAIVQMNIQPLSPPRGTSSPTPAGRVPVPAYYPEPKARFSLASQLPTPPSSSGSMSTSSNRASVVDNTTQVVSQGAGTAIGPGVYLLPVAPPLRPPSMDENHLDLSSPMDSPGLPISNEGRTSSESYHPYRSSQEGRRSTGASTPQLETNPDSASASIVSFISPPSIDIVSPDDTVETKKAPQNDFHVLSPKSPLSRPISTISELYRKIENELIDSYGDTDRRDLDIGLGLDVDRVPARRSLEDVGEEVEEVIEDDIIIVGDRDGDETIELDAPEYSSDMSQSDSEEEPEPEPRAPRVYDAEEDEEGLLSPSYANYPFARNSLVQRKAVPRSHPYAEANSDLRSAPGYLDSLLLNLKTSLRQRGSELSLVDEEEDVAVVPPPIAPKRSASLSNHAPLLRTTGSRFKEIRTHKDAQELVLAVRGEILADGDSKSKHSLPSPHGTVGSDTLTLSEQLAMYGETLEIERLLREKEGEAKALRESESNARMAQRSVEEAVAPTVALRGGDSPVKAVETKSSPTRPIPPIPVNASTLSTLPFLDAPAESPTRVVREKTSASVLKKSRRPHTSAGVVRRDARAQTQGFPLVGAAMEVVRSGTAAPGVNSAAVTGEFRPQTRAGYPPEAPTSPVQAAAEPEEQVYHVLGRTISIPAASNAPPTQAAAPGPRLIPRKPPPSLSPSAREASSALKETAPAPLAAVVTPQNVTVNTAINSTPFHRTSPRTSPVHTTPPSDLVATARARSLSSSAKLARMGFPPDPTPINGMAGGFASSYAPITEKKKFGFGRLVRGFTGRS